MFFCFFFSLFVFFLNIFVYLGTIYIINKLRLNDAIQNL